MATVLMDMNHPTTYMCVDCATAHEFLLVFHLNVTLDEASRGGPVSQMSSVDLLMLQHPPLLTISQTRPNINVSYIPSVH